MSGPLVSLRIRGFRSAHDVALTPGPITALVGASGSGKSNLLVAISKLLAPHEPSLEPDDLSSDAQLPVRIEATLHNGALRLEGDSSDQQKGRRTGTPPPSFFFPAAQRAEGLVDPSSVPPEAVKHALGPAPHPPVRCCRRSSRGWRRRPRGRC